jgi:hypothetical protein
LTCVTSCDLEVVMVLPSCDLDRYFRFGLAVNLANLFSPAFVIVSVQTSQARCFESKMGVFICLHEFEYLLV